MSSRSWWRSIATASAAFQRLVGAGEAGEGEIEHAPNIAVADAAAVDLGLPAAAARNPERAGRLGDFADPGRDRLGIGQSDQGHLRLGDAGFLGGDAFERVAEEGVMIVAQLGDGADQRRRDDVGRVEPAAEPDLDDRGIGWGAGESEEGGGGGRLEEAQLHAVGGVERLGEQGGQRLIVDQPPGEADALVEADQMRAGIDMRREARRLDRRAQKGAGRALAVGPGDVEDRRQALLGIAELGEQRRNPLEPENVGAG